MDVKIFNRRGNLTININAHHVQFNKIWKEIESSWLTCSAVKYANARRAFGIYVIDGENDAVKQIYYALGGSD